jgi:uncharacterized NAD-dependent epimerase/dehydratase family protein
MKRILALTFAPLLVCAISIAPTFAQNSPEASADGEVGASVDTGTTAATGGATNFGAVISAIQTNRDVAGDIEAIADVSVVQIIRVSDIADEESTPALDNALAQNADGVETLRAAVEANAALSARLNEERIAIDDVVAAAETDGGLVLYVR